MNKFLKEIQEQPKALTETFTYYQSGKGKDSLEKIASLWASGKFDKIILTGMGSSYFISYAMASLLSGKGISAFAINAGELLHYQIQLLTPECLLICISQSGESYEVIKLTEHLEKKITLLAICNEANSSLTHFAKYSLLCMAGKEEMTSTKTFITSYLVAYLLALRISGNRTGINSTCRERFFNNVHDMVSGDTPWMNKAIKLLENAPYIQLIGRGEVFASASQSALMFMEASATPASALLGGEFRHGPFEMVKEDFIGIIFTHSLSCTYHQSLKLVNDILNHQGKIILITDKDIAMKNEKLCIVTVQCEEPDLFAIPAIIPIQLIINQLATGKGITPGEFTHGAKVTTIE